MTGYIVKYHNLYKIVKEMFLRLGYSDKQASIVTACLLEADLRNIHSHGVAAIMTYVKTLKANSLHLDAPNPTTVFETASSLVLDGHSGVGFVIADYAVKKTIEKAKKSGLCLTTVRQANHYGFAGYWPEMMAKEGLIGVTCTNTVRCVCPTRSAERSMGTNPISVAVPICDDEPMFLIDMATCVMAHGKLCRSQSFAESGVVPEDVVIDGRGKCMTDFKQILELLHNGDNQNQSPKPDAGGLLPIGGATETHGGHKGYGLALLVELLTAGLSRGVPSKFIPLANEGICFFFMAIDPALFGNAKEVLAHVRYIINEYRNTTPINPSIPVLIPGDKERLSREYSIKEGIALSAEIVQILKDVAKLTNLETKLCAILASEGRDP